MPAVAVANQIRNPEPALYRSEISKIPTLEFAASNPDDGIGFAGFTTLSNESLHDGKTNTSVLITQHDKSGVRRAPTSQPANNILLQILLSLKDDVSDRDDVGQHAWEQSLQHFACRGFLQEEHQIHPSGSTPLKNPCFQR